MLSEMTNMKRKVTNKSVQVAITAYKWANKFKLSSKLDVLAFGNSC